MLFNNIPEINPQTIKYLITESSSRHAEMKKLYERYKCSAEGVPIFTRRYTIDGIEQIGKVNNKINHDYFSEIVDMKVGFFCGVPITYTIDGENYGETEYTQINDKLNEFKKVNAGEDLDAETAKREAICGLAGRLLYHEDVYVKAKLMEPWELIFIGDSVSEPKQTIRVYCTTDIDIKGNKTKLYHADVYDETYITYYQKTEKEEDYKITAQVPHLMPYNPLFGFCNNDEFQGDAEKVIPLIDEYDRTVSDISSELGQFRLAYLAVYGAEITEVIIKAAMKTGAFSLPPEAKMEWLTKALDDAIIEHHLDRVERNIYRFSKTPNMNDAAFAGDITGIALKFKFRAFEDKCTTAELKYKKSLRYQSKILSAIWDNLGIKTDYLDYEYTFTRKYPQNLLEEMQILQTSKGLIPDKLAYSLVSFIDDPEKVIKEMDEQQQEDLDKFIERNKGIDASAPVSKTGSMQKGENINGK